jgi:tetratricopeptide (TPR) repeat protein
LVDVVYAYREFRSKVGDEVRGRVNEFGSIDELVGKLGSVNGRVAVVAGSTTDAVRLRNKLSNAEVIYLPKYYEDAAKEVLSGDALKLARVRHEGLGKGISPSMLREGVSSKDVESIRKLSLGKLGLRDLIKNFLKEEGRDAAPQVVNAVLSIILGVGFPISQAASLVVRFVQWVVDRWGKNKDEVIGGFVRLVGVAREVKNYLCDERLCDERLEAVFDEVAYEWGLNIEEFTKTITNIANIAEGKPLTEEDIKKIINDNLERIEKELNEVKTKVEGLLVGAKVFYIYDVENGLLYGNFIVEGEVPRIKTWVGTAKDDLVTDLVDVGEFRKVAEDVFSSLVKDGRVVLIGPRGIGKSTLATYVAWRSLLGSLGSVVLDKPMDAVIRVDSLNPGDALELNNLIKTAGRRFVVIYDPSPIKAYYEPEAMQVVKHGIESVKNTLRELMKVRNAWVVIILPRELYDEVSKSEELRSNLDEIRSYIIDVDLKNEGFLREVIRKYSGCDNVSDDLVRRVMNFDSYTLVAKYAGIWIRERGCKVEDVDKALRESAGEPKLFFANYIWGTILGKSMDLAKKVSVPLILHATFGSIPEGITYITKAVNEGGAWKLIDRDRLAESKLKSLREADLEPIAKWLSTFHEDLIEETLGELVGLRGEETRKHYIDHGFKDFIKALDWGYEEALGEGREILGLLFGEIVHGESSVEEFMKNKAESNSLLNLGMNLSVFLSTRSMIALKPLTNCWKRAALIIGCALTGHPIVPRPEDLRRDVAESLGDALRECGVDDYLLVGNVIPPLIMGLEIMGLTYSLAFAWAFIDKYNEVVAEVNRILNIARYRGNINSAESLYGLGLASIIANAARLGRDVKPGDADIALRIAPFTIKSVASPDLIKSVLGALEPLRDKAPHMYLLLLATASNMENLDPITVGYIFDKLNEILDNYGDVVRGYARSLVYAIITYAALLRIYLVHFNSEEVGYMVGRVVDLLNELGRFKSSLSVFARAYALAPALRSEYVRKLMKEKLGVDVVVKASEVLKELNDMREKVQDLMRDEEFKSYVESLSLKADEEAVRIKMIILEATSYLKDALAHYRLNNNELDEAEELFNKAAEERREIDDYIGDYKSYLTARGWVLRVKAIKGSLVGDRLTKLVNEFRQLYEETFNEEHFKPTAEYLSTASTKLGVYLVSLALTGDHETINKLLEEHFWVLNADRRASVLTRLMLNALLRPRVGLSSELEGKLSVNPEELIYVFGYEMLRNSLPALSVAFGMISPEDGIKLCQEFNDVDCIDFVLAVKGNSVAVRQLREAVINAFNASNNSPKRFGFDVDESLTNEFKGLVYGLDGRSLVQLIAPSNSMAELALMLRALINGNKELTRAHALKVDKSISGKLLTRLFLEAYKACCDLESEGFRLALARLFFYYV